MRRSSVDARRCGAGIATLFLAVAFSTARAQEEGEPGRGYEAVVPPGQDELLATMLGRETTLPGHCRFNGGRADGPLVQVKYACPAGEVVVDLVHPSVAPDESQVTERFALTLRSGKPPTGLTDSLFWLIRSKESQFEWSWNAVDEAPEAEGTGDDSEPEADQ
jgi:hypothetical protein